MHVMWGQDPPCVSRVPFNIDAMVDDQWVRNLDCPSISKSSSPTMTSSRRCANIGTISQLRDSLVPTRSNRGAFFSLSLISIVIMTGYLPYLADAVDSATQAILSVRTIASFGMSQNPHLLLKEEIE